ncbi:MAG: twin-arginine translocase subunit TatC [Chloroflexota bacterium]|jgi:sec-independent protein translocase protein TatC
MFKVRHKDRPAAAKQKKVNKADLTIPEHLLELRTRLLRSLAALIIAVVAAMLAGETLIEVLAYPIGGVDKLISIEVTENISVFMRVSLLGGFILAFPYLLGEALGFIKDGLEENEIRGLMIAIPFAALLFVSGVLFAYFVMLPAALPFLISFIGIPTTPRLANYYSFVTNLLFWIGVSFQTPLVVYLLARFRLVTAASLARQWRFAIVIIAILAAFVTPTPDPVNMGLLMLPLFVLYLLSILLAKLAVRE